MSKRTASRAVGPAEFSRRSVRAAGLEVVVRSVEKINKKGEAARPSVADPAKRPGSRPLGAPGLDLDRAGRPRRARPGTFNEPGQLGNRR